MKHLISKWREDIKSIDTDVSIYNSTKAEILRKCANELENELSECTSLDTRRKIKIKILENGKGLEIPKPETVHSACVDLRAAINSTIRIVPKDVKIIPAGFKIEIPIGYEAQIRPRSGLAAKNKIGILNSPGTIDSDYRGEVGIILINHGDNEFVINRGDRIAQMAIRKTEDFEFECADELEETERGEGGFGHTGINDEKKVTKTSCKFFKFFLFRIVQELMIKMHFGNLKRKRNKLINNEHHIS